MLTRYQRIVVGFGEIADGLIAVFTLGSVRYNISFRLTAYYAICNMKQK